MSTKSKKLIVPPSGGAVAKPAWADKYAKFSDRDAAAATGGTGWPWLSTRSKHDFKLGEQSHGDKLDVVILGGIRENAYYDEQFDAQNPSPPKCWALNTGLDEATMAPPADLAGKESATCKGCWANAFKSDPKRGRGKACKNLVRLALLAHDGEGNYEKIPGARLRLPPTALGAWSNYTKFVNTALGRPLFSVVTRITITPDDDTQFKLDFECLGLYDDEPLVELLSNRAEEAIEQLESIPEVPADVPTGGPKKKVQRRRKVVRKKGARPRSRA